MLECLPKKQSVWSWSMAQWSARSISSYHWWLIFVLILCSGLVCLMSWLIWGLAWCIWVCPWGLGSHHSGGHLGGRAFCCGGNARCSVVLGVQAVVAMLCLSLPPRPVNLPLPSSFSVVHHHRHSWYWLLPLLLCPIPSVFASWTCCNCILTLPTSHYASPNICNLSCMSLGCGS